VQFIIAMEVLDMALVKCRECGKEVAQGANKCPHCGVSNPGLSQQATNWIAVVAVIVAVIVFFWVFSNMRSCSDDVSRSLDEAERSLQEAQEAIDDWQQEYGN